jgi:hypothetical protein
MVSRESLSEIPFRRNGEEKEREVCELYVDNLNSRLLQEYSEKFSGPALNP